VDGTPFDFREARPVGETRLDHCFTDLERDGDGLVRVG
jgi:aldose 1-epimerase